MAMLNNQMVIDVIKMLSQERSRPTLLFLKNGQEILRLAVA